MKTIIDFAKKALDWLNKFLSRIKGLGYVIALVVLIVFVVNNGCNRRQAEDLFEKVTGLNLQNDILLKENKDIGKELIRKDSLLIVKQLQIDSSKTAMNKAKRVGSYWKGKHDDISGELIRITSDSSYQFLQAVYDYSGELKYPFNEPQVKGMHQTYLENENKVEQIEAGELALLECENTISFLTEAEQISAEKYVLKSTQYRKANKIIDNKDEELKIVNKQLKKKERWSKVKTWLIPVALALGIAIGI